MYFICHLLLVSTWHRKIPFIKMKKGSTHFSACHPGSWLYLQWGFLECWIRGEQLSPCRCGAREQSSNMTSMGQNEIGHGFNSRPKMSKQNKWKQKNIFIMNFKIIINPRILSFQYAACFWLCWVMVVQITVTFQWMR